MSILCAASTMTASVSSHHAVLPQRKCACMAGSPGAWSGAWGAVRAGRAWGRGRGLAVLGVDQGVSVPAGSIGRGRGRPWAVRAGGRPGRYAVWTALGAVDVSPPPWHQAHLAKMDPGANQAPSFSGRSRSDNEKPRMIGPGPLAMMGLLVSGRGG